MIHILDKRDERIVDTIQNRQGSKMFWNDEHEITLKNESVFNWTTLYDNSEHLSSLYRVLIPSEDEGFFHEFIVNETEKYQDEKDIKCVGSYVDLKTQGFVNPQTLTNYPAKQSIQFALSGTEWNVGIIESNALRTTEVDDNDNPYSLLTKIAGNFDLELRYRVEIDGNRLVGRYVDLLRKRGIWHGKEIVLGKDLIGVKRNEVAEIYTSVKVIGPDKGDGTRLSVVYSDDEARLRWGRRNPSTGEIMHRTYTHEPMTENEDITEERLTTIGKIFLNKHLNAVVSYEADAVSLENIFGFEHEKVRLGDTVRVIDESYSPALYLEARVISIRRSISDPSQKTYTLGDFIEYSEDDVKAIARELSKRISIRDQSKRVRARLIEYQQRSTYNMFQNDSKRHDEITNNSDLSNEQQVILDENFAYYSQAYNNYFDSTEDIIQEQAATEAQQATVTQNYLNMITERETFTSQAELSVNDYAQGKTNKLKDAVSKGLVPIKFTDDQLKILENASSTFYLDGQGNFIFTNPNNSNLMMKLTSEGLGISQDGGLTYLTAVTAEGINADAMVAGTMVADFIQGGTLTLGGLDNENGRLNLVDEGGEQVAELNASVGGFLGRLYVGELDSPNAILKTTRDIHFYVSSTGSDSNGGESWADALRSVAEAIRRIPKYIDHNISVTIEANATFYEDVQVYGFHGAGNLLIEGGDISNTTKINGNVHVLGCAMRVDVEQMTIEGNAQYPFLVEHSTYTRAFDVITNGGEVNFYASNGSTLYIEDCQGYEADYDVLKSGYGSKVIVDGLRGQAPRYGLLADYGGYVSVLAGNLPTGDTANQYKRNGGDYYLDPGVTTDSGSAPTAPTAQTTNSWSSTGGNNWSSKGFWSGDGVKQGNWGYGRRTGFWFFGSGPSNTLTGKTIKSMKIKVRRSSSGGISGDVKIYFRWHTHTSKPSGTPADTNLSTDYTTINLRASESATVTLPSSFFADFESGAAKGIGIYVASDSSSNYTVMDSSCQLVVTYEG